MPENQKPIQAVPESMDAEDLVRQHSINEVGKDFDEMKGLMEQPPHNTVEGIDQLDAYSKGYRSTITQKEDPSTEYDYKIEGSEGLYADLASEYGVPANRLKQLVEHEGVRPNDLPDLLGAREILSIREDDRGLEEGRRIDSPSLRVLAEGYHVVNGDLTQFRRLVEAANEGIWQTKDNKPYHYMPGQASIVFRATVDKFLDGQLRVGFVPLAPGVEGLKDQHPARSQSR